MSQSKIFVRNRALGYVSNHIPVVTRYIERRKENLIVTCVGKSFHTYGCSHFRLLSVSGEHPDDITCLAADKYHVYTACGNEVFAWRRGTELKHTYKGHDSVVHILLPFGAHLLSVDEDSTVKVWDIKTEEEALELKFSNDKFKITTMIHPNTYLNKMLIGSEQGQLQLWNLKHSKMIYIFKGWDTSITSLEQAPAVDVVAIGLSNGKIVLHNLKFDETLFELLQDWGPVTCISFRSDGETIMATGSLKGHITLWNLEHRKVESQIMNAHMNSVTGLKCLPNEPLMVSSSPDNSVKLWIFDLADGAGRLLRIREGHAEPPTMIRFYGSDGANIITCGGDSTLRIFSTLTETFNKSLGRASYHRKSSKRKGNVLDDPLIMPPMTEMAAESTREKEWDNIAVTHSGLGVVTTWSYDKLKMGEHKLLPERFRRNYSAVATTVCLTQCGNFVVIGYNTGHVDRFNIQSGIHRGTYGGEDGAHKKAVKGITVDPLNQIVVTAGKDGFVKFWAFVTGKGGGLRAKLDLEEPICWLRSHKETSLIAIALEDFSIVLIDIDTRKVVRRFEGHTGNLTDASFNPDSRWLVSASMDCTIRTWDIPSAKLVDIFKVNEPCTSLHFSPTGEYLVTAHICNLGLYLWSNKTLFSHVSLKAIDPTKPIPTVALPGMVSEQTSEDNAEEEDLSEEYVSVDQLSEDLITMTKLAPTRWQNLLDIELVKKRNKPKEPVKAIEAPFFLPTIPSLEIKFDFSKDQTESEESRIIKHTDFQNLSIFGKMVLNTMETGDYNEPIEMLKHLGPSSIDIEIKSLDSSPEQTIDVMIQFMKMIRFMFKSKVDFELAQAYLGVFLKNHGSTITEHEQLQKYLKKLEKLQKESWNLLREKLFYNLSVVQYLKTL